MKTINIHNATNAKGFTLMELLLALAVVSVVIVIGILAFQQVQSSARAYRAGEQIINLASSTKSLFSPNYTALGTTGNTGATLIVNSGKAPLTMITGTSPTQTLQGLFSATAVTITSPAALGGSAFIITYPSVPANECTTILTEVNPLFQKISVGGATPTVVKDDTAATPVAYVPTAGITACTGGNVNLTLQSI